MKDASDDDIRQVVKEVKPLCDKAEAFLLIDDRVELATELNVSGVHVGKTDMHPSKARLAVGPGAVVGVTANTIDDIVAVRSLDIDYIGLGPFRNTVTKENLAPILGTDGIKAIISEMKQKQIEIPIVAIGGICLEDTRAIMETGANGIAVSGSIVNSTNPLETTRRFVEILKEFE
jgi:thiamine-phosphate pyrophosphorylase